MKRKKITKMLQRLLAGGWLLVSCVLSLHAQMVEGIVTAPDGETLIGVTVMNKNNTANGANTDINGAFSIKAVQGDLLTFAYTGYLTQEVVVGTDRNLRIVMQSSDNLLGEVLVVGYGSQKKSDLTGSVASVSSKDLTQIATPDVVQALQGRAAGVDVTAQTGAPGSGVRVRIRGVGTVNNSDPLYVVDGFQTGDVSYLNPNDITSIEVLKDASATAIYGSRGANGVVLISTKRGQQSSRPVFEFSTYAGTQQLWNKMDMLTASEWAQQRLLAYQLDGITLNQEGSEFVRLDYVARGNYKGTNWQDLVFQNGAIQNYTLSASGGGERNRYHISGTYFTQDGIMRNTFLDKVFLTFSNDLQLTSWLNAGLTANYMNARRAQFDVNYYSGILPQMMAIDPMTQAWDPDLNNWSRADISDASNVGRLLEEQKGFNNTDNKLVANAFLEVSLLKGLKLRSQFGTDLTFAHGKNYYPEFYIAPEEQRNQSLLSESRGQSRAWMWSNYLTWNKDFGKHSLTAMAGLENQESLYRSFYINAYDVPAETALQYVSSAQSLDYQVGSAQGEEALSSYFGRFNYSYDGRYLLTGTIRRDGSSRFTPENRWGTFPSFSAGWNIARESFFQLKPVSSLKLRAGWGQVGNQNSAGNYGYVTTVEPNNLYVFNNVPVGGAIPTTLANRNLRWETTEMTNAGIDAGFFDNRLNVTVDYFIKKTKGMIVQVPLPSFTGAYAPRSNVGDVQNNGIELSVNYRNYDRDLKWDVGVVFSKITNEVVNLGGNPGIPGGGVNVSGDATFTKEGYEIAYFYGYKTDGVFNDQAELDAHVNANGQKLQPDARLGDPKYLDLNSDGLLDGNDRTYLGSGTPDFTYGVTLQLSYKGFDLRGFLQGVQGNEIYNGFSPYFTSTLDVKDRWTPETPQNNIPRTTTRFGNNIRISDLFVEDGSYMRLKNLSVGYTVPQAASKRLRTDYLRIYVAGDNLLTRTKYTGYDPEIGEFYRNPLGYGVDAAGYPVARALRVGLDARF